MKIVVIGGTGLIGLIGFRLVTRLREHGHNALAASPDSGVNTVTGGGLAEALRGASVVVDVSNFSTQIAGCPLEADVAEAEELMRELRKMG